MSLILVYIGIAFTVVALVLTVLPLVGSRRERVRVEFIEEELRTIEALASKRSALLQQLRDLEFDRETDKVSEEDYSRFKRLYELQAVAVMRKLDSLRGGQNWDRIVDGELRAHLAENAPELMKAAFPPEEETHDDDPVVASDPPEAEETGDDEESDLSEESAESEVTDEPDHVEDTEDVEHTEEGELVCGSCGAELASDDRFCRKCGAQTPSSQDAAEASA